MLNRDRLEYSNARTKLEEAVPLEAPFVLFLDPCGACNFACKFCPCNNSDFMIKERHEKMSMELFLKILDDLEEFPERIKVINLYGYGEPLLHPNYVEMVKLIKQRGLCREFCCVFGLGLNDQSLPKEGGRVRVSRFCDSSAEKLHTKIDGISVISLDELLEQKLMNNHVIIISPMHKGVCEEIFSLLVEKGIHEEDIYKYYDYYFLKESFEKQYFDKIMDFGEDEVFVDGGCFDFSTGELFIKKMAELGLEYKKIYAFEPDKANVEKCKEKISNLAVDKIELLPYGLWSDNEYLEFSPLGNSSSHFSELGILGAVGDPSKQFDIASEKVKVIALDSYIKEKVTFIKMDIEGSELGALKGAKHILLKDKPKLAICLYHKKEDLWEIPYYIKTLVPEYKLYIRHYSNYLSETVLYAI